MAGGDCAGASPIAKAVRVGTEEQMVSPAVAVHAVPVLVASVAACPGFKVLGAVGVNVPYVATHGAEVVHVDDWWGGRTCGGVLELRRAEGEVDKHAGGRGVDCRRVVQCKTLVSGVMTFPCFPPYLLQIVS